MNCTECKDWLVAYVEDALAQADLQALAVHLDGCPSCRAERDRLATTHTRLLRDGQADPPPALATAVMDRILRSEPRTQGQTIWSMIMAHRYAAAGVAAVACVVAIAGATIVVHRLSGDAGSALSPQPDPPLVAPGPLANGENVALKPGPSGARLLRERLPSLKQQVAEAEVIVVAAFVDSAPAKPKRPRDAPETLMRFRVARKLKGNLNKKIITVQHPSAPVGAGVNEFAGKEWILLLTPDYMAGKHRYAALLTIKLEPAIRAILAANNRRSR